MRCDLHVHTTHSGMCTVPVLNRVCRESYSDPQAVYDSLKRRGMHLVTVTDHDSIDAVDSLRKHSDFFLSEEVTCWTPSGTELHVGVYGITEQNHVELQRRRRDLPSLVAYLGEHKLFFTANHVFSSLTGSRTDLDFAFFEEFFPGLETLNGQMSGICNRSASMLAERWNKAVVGGSDAHTLGSVGLTYTEIPHARDQSEFLEGLRSGHGRVYGEAGDYLKLTRAVLEIGCAMIREKPWMAFFWPLFFAAPVITLAHMVKDYVFARKWSARLERKPAHGLDRICAQESLI